MNDTWHFLREFESKDLIKRYIKKKYDFEINTAKAHEIASAFKQGRSYFDSVKLADNSVQPLLLYYGIVSLSRGLNNNSFYRCGSSGINWNIEYPILKDDLEFSLRDLSYSFPDLYKSVESWLNTEIPSLKLETFESDGIRSKIKVSGQKIFKEILPEPLFKNQIIIESGNSTIVDYKFQMAPHLCQKWKSVFEDIGDPYVIPPLGDYIFLNDISKMFAVSFIFGTISRYYPTTWNNINSGIKNDSILPFAINLIDFLQLKYPQIVIDFLEAPHK